MGVETFHGRCLYSTLLPADMNWQMGKARIQEGILISGTLDQSTLSGSGASIGMLLYHTYGPKETVEWLNASYRMLNRYLIHKGITLGLPHIELTPAQQGQIDQAVEAAMSREDLQFDVEKINDPVIRARREIDITQELNNVRESAAVVVMDPKEPTISVKIQGRLRGDLILYVRDYAIFPDCRDDESLCIYNAPVFPEGATIEPINERVNRIPIRQIVTIPGEGKSINVDMYGGQLTIIVGTGANQQRFSYSMGIIPRFVATLVQVRTSGEGVDQEVTEVLVNVDRTYDGPNPLRAMVQSKARGNATNAVQIAGIIGQQSYSSGRIPRVLPASNTPAEIATATGREFAGPRTMPAFPFGSNTPKSRGFIAKSYLQGKSSAEDFASHAASRENLTSNTDLTPRTGYFERRVRTFTENLRITKIGGRQVVTNERGIITMYDYLLDSSRMFKVRDKNTFVDVDYERRHMKQVATRSQGPQGQKVALIVTIPYFSQMGDYLRWDQRLSDTVRQFMGVDVILVVDSRVEIEYPDYYAYLRDILPSQTGHTHLVVIGTIPNVNSRQMENVYLSFTEYDTVSVMPLDAQINLSAETVATMQTSLADGMSAALAVTVAPIDGVSYPVRRGDIVPVSILYQMLMYGSSYRNYPLIVRPNTIAYNMLPNHTLLESLIISGNIVAI